MAEIIGSAGIPEPGNGPSHTAGDAVAAADSPAGSPAGIDVVSVSAWLEGNVADTIGPFDFDLIAGGHSNLTYMVTDRNGTRMVLRRPPLGHRLASAHDMGREHRIISGLQSSAVPVAPALGFCDDDSVNGAPFYVMGFVDGHVIRDAATATSVLDLAGRRRASESIVDTMAAIHDVDLVASGLDTLGKHSDYIARQLHRWDKQWNLQKTRDLPTVDAVHAGLLERIPEQGPASIVHGDYRLDNCMVDGHGNVVAVLDWEICTLGDPLADLGLLMVYWTGPDDEPSAWTGASTTTEGFLNRADLADRYARTTGRDLADLDYYVAFAYWKLACILEGVYARYLGGALGQRDPAELLPFKLQVEGAAVKAAEALERSR